MRNGRPKFKRIEKVYNFYTKGLNYGDFEKLIKQEVPDAFSYYLEKTGISKPDNRNLRENLVFLKQIFVSFLEQLTPIRRVIYSASLVIFIFCWLFTHDWNWVVFSFFLINFLLFLELGDKLVASDELSVARDIQVNLLPGSPPEITNFDIIFYSEPAKIVGGDYYDFKQKEDACFLIIGDISGKGMAAAIPMVQVQSIFNYLLIDHCSPKEILCLLNTQLKKHLRKGSFFTASMAAIYKDGSIKICRAGHLPTIHYKKSENACSFITGKGIGIGIGSDELFESNLEEIAVQPEPGDVFLFYTDGVTEARTEYLTEFGEERLKRLVIRNAGKSAAEIKDAIVYDIAEFTRSAPAHDDLTFTVIKAV